MTRIVIAGAGSIGCFVGGQLAAAGRDVVLLARARIAEEIAAHGLTLTDYAAAPVNLAPRALRVETDTAHALAGADIVLVTVKSGATAEMGALIGAHAPRHALVVSLQNGVGNAGSLRSAVAERRVLGGMVPFNVVQRGEGRFHRGTSGEIAIEAGAPGLAERLRTPGLPVREVADIRGVLWGKLLVNLNNALNALSGLPLKEQLENRAWRLLVAEQMTEALAALAAAGIAPHAATPAPPWLLPHVLSLPDPLFRVIARRMLTIDPLARSSMWEDLERRRPTEIDALQGEVVALAARLGRSAQLNDRVRALVKAAEAAGAGAPGLSPEAVRLG